MPPSYEQSTAEILSRLDIAAEFSALGVEITGRAPNANGWLACRAFNREDRTPSAAINVRSGYYVDLGGEGLSLSLFNFAVKFAPGQFSDWKVARRHFAEKSGITLTKGGRAAANPSEQLAFEPWVDSIVAIWAANHKPGVTVEAVRAAGGQLARYPAKSKQFKVIALPVYGPRLIESDPIGWVLYQTNGKPLPVWDKNGKITRTVKMKTVSGGRSGLMGFHGIARMANTTDPSTRIIWKTAGPSDLLTLWSAIPSHLRNQHLVVSNSGGENENISPSIAALFTGYRVFVVHDADKTGEIGAIKWLEALVAVAAEVRQVRLPYAIVENHGRDLRDYLTEGETNSIDCHEANALEPAIVAVEEWDSAEPKAGAEGEPEGAGEPVGSNPWDGWFSKPAA